MFASVLTNDSTKRNESRNYCEHLRCKKTSHQIRKIRKSNLMIVTAANSLIEPPNGDSDGAEKNISGAGNKNFLDENGANVSVTSPPVGEVGAAQQRRERGMPRGEAARCNRPRRSPPPPDPPPQGGREQQGPPAKQPRQNNQPRRDRRDVHGWVVLDKPIGMTSTHAGAVGKRVVPGKAARHAG